KINFYIENTSLLGTTNPASSVFLSISPTDNTNVLSWDENVPWENYEYTIFRFDELGGLEPIASVPGPPYSDTGLLNGKEYCYLVQSLGSYGVQGVMDSLKNDSQEACSVPVDNIAPCPPALEVRNACDETVNCTDENLLRNTLTWINPMDLCEETDDVVGYEVYYSSFEGSGFQLIAKIEDSGLTEFEHKPDIGIAGCYYVTALDTFENRSAPSNIVCVD